MSPESPRWRDAGAQAAWIAFALALCPLAALVSTRDPEIPVARARALVDFERSVGLFFEPALHAWLQRHDVLLAAAGKFYVWMHVPALMAVLCFSWFADRTLFRILRNSLLATQLVVVAGYLLVPTAPPRLLDGLGFRDTLTQLWGTDGAALAHSVQSPYAALPSGHVAFAVIVAAGVWLLFRRRVVRVAALGYPALVTLVVLATANHFWLDALAGACAALVGLYAASRTADIRVPERSLRRRQAPLLSNALQGHGEIVADRSGLHGSG